MKEKQDYLSVLEILACFLVVFIHVSSKAITGLDRDSFQLMFIFALWKLASFVVPCFIFISGFKFAYNIGGTKSFSYKKYICKRAKAILLPYLLWVAVYYSYYIIIEWYTFDWHNLIMLVFFGKGVAHLYFVTIIFQFYLLAPMWVYILKKWRAAVCIVASLVATLFFKQYLWQILNYLGAGFEFGLLDRVFTSYLLYWVIGLFAGKSSDKFKKFMQEKTVLILPAYAVLGTVHVALSFMSFQEKIIYFNAEAVHLLFCTLSILAAYCIVLHMAKFKRLFSFLKGFSIGSYYIYLSHVLVLELLDYNLKFSSYTQRFIVVLSVIYFALAPLCFLYAKVKAIVQKMNIVA